MLHLLTEEHKKKVTAEYNRRLLIVVSALVAMISILGIGMALPSYFLAHGRYAEAEAAKKRVDDMIAARQNDTSADSIKNISTSISALRMFGSQADSAGLMVKLVSRKPRGVSITHMAYFPPPSKTQPASLELAGKADTRANLVLFAQQVKADGSFANVNVPLSNFAREADIDFTMRVDISQSSTSTAESI